MLVFVFDDKHPEGKYLCDDDKIPEGLKSIPFNEYDANESKRQSKKSSSKAEEK